MSIFSKAAAWIIYRRLIKQGKKILLLQKKRYEANEIILRKLEKMIEDENA